MFRIYLSLLAVMIGLWLTACQSPGKPPDAALGAGTTGGTAGFPALELCRTASYSAEDLVATGSAYDVALPYAKVAAAGSELIMDPDGTAVAEIAYATYRFNLEDYDRAETITLDWSAQGGGQAWLGVSNWVAGAWKWHALPAANWLELDFAPLIHAVTHEMYVVVACTGTDPWTLERVRIGEPLAPAITGVAPEDGAPGANVEFSAAVSGVPPLGYAWDFGGGAEPNISTEGTPLVTLSSEGVYEATVTVTNAGGEDTYQFTLTVVEPQPGWVHTWGTTNDERCAGRSAIDAAGNIYATSWRNVYDNTINGLFVTKYSDAGDFLWTYGYGAGVNGDAGDTFDGTCVCVDVDYNVYVTGTWDGPIEDPGLDVFLLKLDQDGNELWAQTWNGGSNDFGGPAVLDTQGNIYICSHTWSYGPDPDGDFPRNAALLRWDADGEFAWARIWGEYGADSPVAVALNAGGNILMLVSTKLSSQAMCLLEYTPDGELVDENIFGCGGEYPAGMVAGDDGNIYITGSHNNDSLTLYRFNPTLDAWDWHYSWRPDTMTAFGQTIEYDPQGAVLVGGYLAGDGAAMRLLLLKFDGTGSLVKQRMWTAGGMDESQLSSIKLANHGMIYISGAANHAGGSWHDVSGTLTELAPVVVTGAPETEQQTGAIRSRTPVDTWEPAGVLDTGAGGLGPDMLFMKQNFWDIGLE